ncbi:P-loop containing nucleoside triphosphate hydrolase protein [Ramicandelaber brevisporus]|nr:P-loop containing nucleoside triphosphate hydrolase protein [Ramicandelaber brevisporus]
MTADQGRRQPNILITGTPGCGKSTLSELVSAATDLQNINVGQVVKDKQLHDGYIDEFDTYDLNEDKLIDELEVVLEQNQANGLGSIVDFHSCDLFPERWFDLVIVLVANNTVIFDRLTARGYSEKKVQENVECEIMQVVLDEARESYAPEIVVELKSEDTEDLESNVERIQQWIEQFRTQHSQ